MRAGRVSTNASVFALGLVLIVGGAWGIWRGSGYIQIEQGWSAVISGSVAVTGGILTLAIGCVLLRLDALQQALTSTGAGALGAPSARPVMEEASAAPMPLGIEGEPAGGAKEPHSSDLFDWPAERHAAMAADPVESHGQPAAGHGAEVHDNDAPVRLEQSAAVAEPPAAQVAAEPVQPVAPEPERPAGRAPELGQAAGVGDEPELDAAIEELLAEERRGGQRTERAGASEALAGAHTSSPQVFADASLPDDAGPPAPIVAAPAASEGEPEQPPPARGGLWKSLFSARPRVQARRSENTAPPQPSNDPPAPPEALPKTGDDWFDRALAGLDEVADGAGSRGHPASFAPAAPVATAVEKYEPATAEEARVEPVAEAEPAVIGRYTSGNTTYVMFADGSIEAETPSGILRFASLAELKTYVEGGQ